MTYVLSPIAISHLTDIYNYTFENWGEAQADKYLNELYSFFDSVSNRDIAWRPIPAEFSVQGYFARCNKHFVYWRSFPNEHVGIVAVIHERRHQMERLKDIPPGP